MGLLDKTYGKYEIYPSWTQNLLLNVFRSQEFGPSEGPAMGRDDGQQGDADLPVCEGHPPQVHVGYLARRQALD